MGILEPAFVLYFKRSTFRKPGRIGILTTVVVGVNVRWAPLAPWNAMGGVHRHATSFAANDVECQAPVPRSFGARGNGLERTGVLDRSAPASPRRPRFFTPNIVKGVLTGTRRERISFRTSLRDRMVPLEDPWTPSPSSSATVQGEFEEQALRTFLEANGIPTVVRGEALRKTHAFILDGLGAVGDHGRSRTRRRRP